MGRKVGKEQFGSCGGIINGLGKWRWFGFIAMHGR